MKTVLAPSVAQGLALTMQTQAASLQGALAWALSALGLEPALERVGYITPGDIVEYSAVLGARHVTPGEVFALGALVRSRKIRLARKTVPVAVVRVVFRSMEEALRERRPLTDQGVQVWAYDTGGALVQLDP